MKRIHDSLHRVFQGNRLVFWYDATGEWASTFDAFSDVGVVKLRVAGNEFGTRVRIIRDASPDTRFLIYSSSVRPPDADNWLLDLLLQSYEYKADKASLALQDVGLPHEFRHLAEEHAAFFRATERNLALKDKIAKDDQVRDVRLKMMAVLAGTEAEVDSLLLRFLATAGLATGVDPVANCLGDAALVEAFWREVERVFSYKSDTPSLRDFVVWLFRGANPFDGQVALPSHAKVLLQRWKDSQANRESFRQWALQMERELHISERLTALEGQTSVGEWDTFEIFEKFALHQLCKSFDNGATAVDLRAGIKRRMGSFWWAQHQNGYAGLENAVQLRELLQSAELSVESMQAGVGRYTTTWWRIDMAYRLCTLNLRLYGNEQVTKQISKWAEKAYVNNFLLPLADRWGDQVRRADTWYCEDVKAHRRFFDDYVEPFRAKGQKVFVIISDALRYEAAMDFAQRLRSANRWTADVEPLLGALPSYTQLGMASLLPGKQRAVDGASTNVTVDGRSSVGTDNREQILRATSGPRATTLTAEDFLLLNSKTDGRALMRDHDVIYIFHNHIDKVGDDLHTEGQTFDAVEKAFEDLDLIVKKVANINGSNMLLTADHGFLFQQDEVVEGDMASLPVADEWLYRSRRFALGRGIVANPMVKVFDAASLNVSGDWSAAFPLSLGRFPLQGSGKRFVHGGISLQEVVVPVVKIRKTRIDDATQVDVEILRVPTKITTGQVAISLFQDRPALDKTLPLTLRVGVFAKDGTSLSEIKTHVFDSKDEEARLREISMVLVLSHAADAFNNQEVELRLVKMLEGTNQSVVYKTHSLKLQKPFASDFDDN
jgi:uncharacterized protein (TIGR02687 family)